MENKTTADYVEVKTSDLLTQLERLTEAIESEFDLISARIGWLVTSEAFIFTAYATTMANVIEKSQHVSTIIEYLAFALPLFGIILAILVALSVFAAHSAIEKLKKQRDLFLEQLPQALRIVLISSRDHEHILGNIPSQTIPWLIIIVWIGALVSVL